MKLTIIILLGWNVVFWLATSGFAWGKYYFERDHRGVAYFSMINFIVNVLMFIFMFFV